MALSPEQIRHQSQSALKQWSEIWKKHASHVSKFEMKNLENLEFSGVGRACLLIANGWSFEKEIETIKKYQGNVDIFVCDKALGHCLDHGIVPTYVIACDANVNYERYMEKWKDQLQDTIIFQNVCANPKWVDNGNWKDRYFFCVKDSINSEEIFQPLSKCPNIIAAGTNVSNSMVIFLTQCDNHVKKNFFGYDKYILIGFDYCWTPNGNYYAFDREGNGKRYYMRHIYGRTVSGELCYTSNNLAFSLQWLEKYISACNLPVVNCSQDSVLSTIGRGKIQRLSEHMQYKGSQAGAPIIDLGKKSRELLEKRRKIEEEIKQIKRSQYYDFAATV